MDDRKGKYDVGQNGRAYGYEKKEAWIWILLIKFKRKVMADIFLDSANGKNLLMFQ